MYEIQHLVLCSFLLLLLYFLNEIHFNKESKRSDNAYSIFGEFVSMDIERQQKLAWNQEADEDADEAESS